MSVPFSLNLPGGITNLLGGGADELYLYRMSDSQYRPYLSIEEACATIPVPLRANRTVNILDEEYIWKSTNTTNAGLKKKTSGATGTSGPKPSMAFFKIDPDTGNPIIALSTASSKVTGNYRIIRIMKKNPGAPAPGTMKAQMKENF